MGSLRDVKESRRIVRTESERRAEPSASSNRRLTRRGSPSILDKAFKGEL